MVISSQGVVSITSLVELFAFFFLVFGFLLFEVFFVRILGFLLIGVAFGARIALVGDFFGLFEGSRGLTFGLGWNLGLIDRSVNLRNQSTAVFLLQINKNRLVRNDLIFDRHSVQKLVLLGNFGPDWLRKRNTAASSMLLVLQRTTNTRSLLTPRGLQIRGFSL